MTVVDLDIDSEILSTHEQPPTPAEKPASDPAISKCRFCPDEFTGGARFVQRGLHEKRKHPDEWKAGRKEPVKKATKAKKAPVKKATASVTSPRAKRISAAESIATNVGRVAKFLGGVDAPLSRALVFSAPATGQAVDELVAGTVVDRIVVQKFAGVSDKWERLGGVIAFPVLVAVISRNPALFPALESELRDATLDVLIANIPTLEKQKAREQKAVQALRKLGQIDERFATSTDPIGLILQDLFAFQEPAVDDGD
jgi:hypothetical protein